jgi:hypothetical protein
MCGTPAQATPEARPSQVAEAVAIAAVCRSESESSLGVNDLERAIDPAVGSIAARGEGALESAWTHPQRSLPSFDIEPESEPVPHNYRVYAGVILAVLLALLLYMARRGTKATPGAEAIQSATSKAIPPAAPALPEVSPQLDATESAPSEASPPDTAVPSNKQRPVNSRKNRPSGGRRSSPIATVAESFSVNAAEQSGAADFAMAEKYLGSAQGMPRDSREAAQWLWKAVGKGNVEATVALSDLYLHGEGVPKNCDQARLLLDAAARKGGKAAAARLRNLQAFGCE